MQLNPEKMKTLVKKASFNYLLGCVQLSFEPDKITSKMMSPNQDFIVSIETQSNDVLMNGDDPVKFNLYMNGVRSKKKLDDERKAGLTISEIPKRSKAKTQAYYNRIFTSHRNEIDGRNAEIMNTEDPAVRKLKFGRVDKTGTVIVGGEHSLTLVDDNHVSIRDITFKEELEEREAFFTCDLNEEILKILNFPPKKLIQSGKFYFLIEGDEIKFEMVQFCKDKIAGELVFSQSNGVDAISIMPFSKIQNKFESDFGIEFNYRNFLHVLDVFKDKDYEMQIFFADPEGRTEPRILVRSKDGEEKYYILNCEIVLADYEKRFMLENDEDFLSNIVMKSEMPKKWDYTESVKKAKKILLGWKNLSNDMLTELWTAKKILKKTPSERAQIMHNTYVGWMTWTQYCKDIGHSTQVVNRWIKRAFGEQSVIENPPEIKKRTNCERKLPDNYLNTVKNVLGSRFGENVSGRSKHIFLDLQHQTGNEREYNISKLMQKIDDKKVDGVIVLVNSNGTYSDYFQPFFNGVMCFTNHRIQFEGNGNNAQGSCFVYFGENDKKFVEEFSQYGVVMKKVELVD